MAQYQFPHLMALSLQQRKFVMEYAIRGFEEEGKAATEAGYKNARSATTLLRNKKVQAAIEEQRRKAEASVEEEYGPLRDRIIREYCALAFSSIGHLVTFDRKQIKLKPSDELAEETLAAIRTVKQGNHGVEVGMYDKGVNLERLAKMLGFLQPDQPPPGGVTLIIGNPESSAK